MKPLSTKAARLLRLADRVEKSKTFDMSDFFHECGTPACIAGHAFLQKAEDKGKAFFGAEYGQLRFEETVEYLELSKEEAILLFTPSFVWAHYEARPGEPGFISAELAVRVLRRFALTGVIDWTIREDTDAHTVNSNS
ncbi:MAG: hypothetical protein MN733_26320 [Nitrososphaera sp.]|nr:hypothetical protein [Nitrososphaera sp.]